VSGERSLPVLASFVWLCFATSLSFNAYGLATSAQHTTLFAVATGLWGFALVVESFNLWYAWRK
jgi:hypothetical protein